MATIKDLKRRIKAANNISQITKAMEMVSASKMRRAQEKALASRPYALKLDSVLKRMSGLIDSHSHVLLQTKKPSKSKNIIAVLLISPEKGLCGSLNSNLFKTVETLEKNISQNHSHLPIEIQYITVGKKAREYVLKTNKILFAEFVTIPDRPLFEDVIPITKILMDGFKTGRFYKVFLSFTDFINTMNQKPIWDKILPIDTEDIASGLDIQPSVLEKQEYIFEPSSKQILNWLLPYYFELSIYQKILESQASEHSARMVAMRNASENAAEIIKFLNLQYNRKRQNLVTTEIADIVVSRMAIS